jgi:hypothetical protein
MAGKATSQHGAHRVPAKIGRQPCVNISTQGAENAPGQPYELPVKIRIYRLNFELAFKMHSQDGTTANPT